MSIISNVYEAREIMYKHLSIDKASEGIILGEQYHSVFPWDCKILNALGICYCIKGLNDKGIETYQKALKLKISFEDADMIIVNLHALAMLQKGRYNNPPHLPLILNPMSNITFTVTTCKRFNLFERTINSFMACCKEDLWRIRRWICVDDNSSNEDREKMQKQFPFFEFVFKDASQKGHPQSMNIILNEAVKLPYLLHMEDDWEFIFEDNCITKCLEILNCDFDVKQCVFNKNYASRINDSTDVTGGFPKTTPGGTRYFHHEFSDSASFNLKYLTQNYHIKRCLNLIPAINDENIKNIKCAEDFVEYIKTNPTGGITSQYFAPKNCSFWPHFTFNPSVIDTAIFKLIGPFDTNGHFEKDYGLRYIKHGYKTAYLEGMRCLHTGWESENNAYKLNNCNQFHL